MGSKTQKTEKIRARKHRANKDNLKKREKQLRENLEILQKIVQEK